MSLLAKFMNLGAVRYLRPRADIPRPRLELLRPRDLLRPPLRPREVEGIRLLQRSDYYVHYCRVVATVNYSANIFLDALRRANLVFNAWKIFCRRRFFCRRPWFYLPLPKRVFPLPFCPLPFFRNPPLCVRLGAFVCLNILLCFLVA